MRGIGTLGRRGRGLSRATRTAARTGITAAALPARPGHRTVAAGAAPSVLATNSPLRGGDGTPPTARSFWTPGSMATSETDGSKAPNGLTTAGNSAAGAASEYDEWVRRLYTTNLYQPVKMGLDNIRRLYELLGRPLDGTPVVHIAGTNGKGSVALKLARTLEAAGAAASNTGGAYKVGLFVSPHISSFRERMQINGECISEAEVVELLPRIYDLCHQHKIPATFFELTTALAMAYFRQAGADAVVLETGLGGRLDATNILASPALTIVTSIGLEHTRILGDTLDAIAREKAGIFKARRPVLVGPVAAATPEVDAALRTAAAAAGAGPYRTTDEVLGDATVATDGNGAPVDYDVINSRIVAAAARLLRDQQQSAVEISPEHRFPPISEEAVRLGTSQRPPCRFERLQVSRNLEGGQEGPIELSVVLDVAHNPEAMDYLVQKLQATFDPSRTRLRLVVGMSSDKDLERCGRAVLGLAGGDAGRVHLVQAASPRAATLPQLLAIPALQGAHHDAADPSVATQVRRAMDLAFDHNARSHDMEEILVVCGSVFIMADAREALGIDEPRDSAYVAQVGGPGTRNSQENFGK